MATIVYAMLTSLDGYIAGPSGDIDLPVPEEELHRHFNEQMRRTSIALCGRRMYETMRFWDSPEREIGAGDVEHDFARAWRETPKIVFSTTLQEVGPNARLVKGDVEAAARSLKADTDGRRQAVLPIRPVAGVEAARHGASCARGHAAALRARGDGWLMHVA